MCKIVLKSANEIRFIREIKFLNHLLDGALCINFLMIFYCFFFWFFNHDFADVATSNTANDDITNYVTPKIFNTTS